MLDLPVHYLPRGLQSPLAPADCPARHRALPSDRRHHVPEPGTAARPTDREGNPAQAVRRRIPRWIGETACRAAHTGRYIAREEKAHVFRSAAGVLNTMHPAEVSGVNARLFEASGCGAAVLTEFRPTVPELFAIGREVLVFHDFDDLVEQATRLLSERGLTARIGDAAAQRAHRDHTYDLRVTAILDKLS